MRCSRDQERALAWVWSAHAPCSGLRRSAYAMRVFARRCPEARRARETASRCHELATLRRVHLAPIPALRCTSLALASPVGLAAGAPRCRRQTDVGEEDTDFRRQSVSAQ